MQLVFLLLLLVAPYALLTLAGSRFRALRFTASAGARVGLSLFFTFTALGHFVKTEKRWSPCSRRRPLTALN